MNALRAPEGIGEGHGADELGDLRIDGRATGSIASRLPVPERAEALPVPANHGLRLNDMERFAPPCPPLREPHPEDAVEEADPRSLGAAAEQGELLSPRQVLKNEVGADLQRSAQSAQQSEYEGHCCAGWLDRRPTSSVATDILANDTRSVTPCELGSATRLELRRKRPNEGSARSASSRALESRMAAPSITVTFDGAFASGVRVAVTTSASPRSCAPAAALTQRMQISTGTDTPTILIALSSRSRGRRRSETAKKVTRPCARGRRKTTAGLR